MKLKFNLNDNPLNTLFNIVYSSPLQSGLGDFQLQPAGHMPFEILGVGIRQRRRPRFERVDVLQFPHQELLVDLLGIAVLVHVEVEGFAEGEPLLLPDEGRGEVVLEYRFLHIWNTKTFRNFSRTTSILSHT